MVGQHFLPVACFFFLWFFFGAFSLFTNMVFMSRNGIWRMIERQWAGKRV